jgi:hypothetical protein
MTPNEEGLIRFSGQSGPDISCCIAMDLDGKFFELLSEPGSRFCPHRRKGDPLGAIFIRGKRFQFLSSLSVLLGSSAAFKSLPPFLEFGPPRL